MVLVGTHGQRGERTGVADDLQGQAGSRSMFSTLCSAALGSAEYAIMF
jgi:hypothetical protein